jgi:predicted RNase H-like nuclease
MDTYVGFDSAWTNNPKAPGAICAVVVNDDSSTQFHQPLLVSFAEAHTFIQSVRSDNGTMFIALDQPTVVPNATGMRPVERVAASLVSWLGGGVQPANRSRLGMFCDASPIWHFLEALGAIEDPEKARKATTGTHLIEVFPALALASFDARFFGRRAGPKYNPANRRKFRKEDWTKVAEVAARESCVLGCEEMETWCRDVGKRTDPHKADQDMLDSVLCALVALRWRLRPRHESLILGDLQLGYMVLPASPAVREYLSGPAQKLSVPIDGAVPVLSKGFAAAVGSVLGLTCAYGAMQLLATFIPTEMMASMPYLRGLGLNLHVIVFACVISLAAGVLFSLTPVVRLPGTGIREGLTEDGRGAAGTTWRRFGSNLVVVELAAAMVLLVSAGLLGKSFYRLLHADTGIEPDHLAAIAVVTPASAYAKDAPRIALERQILGRVTRLPGVTSAAIASDLPVGDGDGTTTFRILGRPYRVETNEVNDRMVSAGYFATVQARLLRGRYFLEIENASKPRVVIVNEALAKRYFPGQDPVGQRIGDDQLSAGSLKEIVGVVDDIKEGPLDMTARPAYYQPFNQATDDSFYLVVRTVQAEASLFPALTTAIHEIDPGIATYGAVTMSERIHDSPSAYLHRSSAYVVGGFAAMALLLGVVGLYGVIAYSVSQRTREIGVRMALGAQRNAVAGMVLREALRLIVVGIGAGVLRSLATAGLLRPLLFGVRPWDWTTLIGVAALLGVAAIVASYLPAHRAASVNPVEALRAE